MVVVGGVACDLYHILLDAIVLFFAGTTLSLLETICAPTAALNHTHALALSCVVGVRGLLWIADAYDLLVPKTHEYWSVVFQCVCTHSLRVGIECRSQQVGVKARAQPATFIHFFSRVSSGHTRACVSSQLMATVI